MNQYKLTNEQALKILKSKDPNLGQSVQFKYALENAIAALEKEKEKEVIQHGDEGADECWFECPNCEEYITGYWREPEIIRCEKCGQKLEW